MMRLTCLYFLLCLQVWTCSANGDHYIDHDVEQLGLDLFLAIDKSSSIFPSQLDNGIQFAKLLIQQFNIANGNIDKVGGTRLAIYTFEDSQKEELSLHDETIDSTKAAVAKLDSIKCLELCEGGSNMAAALARIDYVSKHTRRHAKKVIFMISDGVPTADPRMKSVLTYAQSVKTKGFIIYTVGIGGYIDENFLKELSSEPIKEHMFLLKNFENFADIISLIRNEARPPPPPEKCGFIAEKFYETRNLENGPVKLGHWPSLAAILVKDYDTSGSRFACSGILICQNWVLTTAQCMMSIDNVQFKPEDVYVILGEDDIGNSNPNEQIFYAVDIKLHHKFVQNKTMIRNDIALIKLNGKAKLNDYVRTACILNYAQDFFSRPEKTGYMVGWLITSEEQARITEEAVKEHKAHHVMMMINGDDMCGVFGYDDIKPHKYKCEHSLVFSANAMNEPSKICNGIELGAPLFVADSTDITQKMMVSGIASYVEGCTLDSKYALFTRTGIYYDWIRSTVDFCTDEFDNDE